MSDQRARFVAVVAEPFEYVDRSLPTASWWDRYEIVPGEYEVEFTTVDHRPADPETAYYARVRFAAVLKESYRVNRLFTASSGEHEHPDTAAHVSRWMYRYAFGAGKAFLVEHDYDTATMTSTARRSGLVEERAA